MARTLSDEARKQAEAMVTRFPKKEGALLNVFRIVERDMDYLDEDAVQIAAEICEMPPSKAWGVFTFYSTFKNKHDGKHRMWVCSTLPCALAGSEQLYDYIKEKLELDDYGTTKDGLLTLKKAECLGACGTAPCLQLEEDYYENLTLDKLDSLIADLQKGVERPAGFTQDA